MYDKSHGSPYDRGSADRYYGRPWKAHYKIHDGKETTTFDHTQMTPAQIDAYSAGYSEEEDRKDYGVKNKNH